ncbi:Transmembrane protein 44 [Pteropus alecto]|uniref:Transmembrane protein 44 n=1 Tax=Pteropus alecto TaxID=9402 RepID=L5L3K4_PTEAL|nr:Transmembrane protein 44 [Pteropus alecto]
MFENSIAFHPHPLFLRADAQDQPSSPNYVELLYLRCAKKSGQDQSALCAACCLLTSLCDTVGAILARQLTIQVFTGAYLAAVDLVNFVFILFPVCGSKFKSNLVQGSQERKRRRQLRASIFALALPLSLGPGWVLWATVPKASGPIQGPQRKLLESLLQDNTEILGYLLGGVAAFGSWASRIPPLSRIVRLGLGMGCGSPWWVLDPLGALLELQVTRAEGSVTHGGWSGQLDGPGEMRRPLIIESAAFSPFLVASETQALRKKPPGLDQQVSH